MEDEVENSIYNDTSNRLASALLRNYEPRLLESEDSLQDLTYIYNPDSIICSERW